MATYTTYGWMVIKPSGRPHFPMSMMSMFWIDGRLPIMRTRKEAIEHTVKYKSIEAGIKTWKKLYRKGYRCVKVKAEWEF